MFAWVLATLVLILFFYWCKKPSGLPPGRWGLPIIGYFPLYTNDLTKVLHDMRREFGDVFTWKFGNSTNVIMCNPKVIKAVFSKPECQRRPLLYRFHVFNFRSELGLLRSNGHTWKEGRRFALRHLKDLGMGKSSLEGSIQHEAAVLAQSYEDIAGQPTYFMYNVNIAVLNVLWKLVADKRYDIDDKEAMRFQKLYSQDLDIIQGPMAFLDYFPFLRYLVPYSILNRWMKLDDLDEHIKKCEDYFTEIIKEHDVTFDPENQRDYIDAYFKEIETKKGDPNTIFKEDLSIASFFRAGSETIASTLKWMVVLLANSPEVQKKVQKEIDEVLSTNRGPSLQDRERMPYTDAMLLEVMRMSSTVPLGLPHMNTEDIDINGYHIPKGTTLFACSESCHRDPKFWERPYEFYPEHFLDADGKVITKKEGFLPFSLGRRQCLGETLARVELFIFATCLLQRLSICPEGGKPIKIEVDKSDILLHRVKPYKVIFKKRERPT